MTHMKYILHRKKIDLTNLKKIGANKFKKVDSMNPKKRRKSFYLNNQNQSRSQIFIKRVCMENLKVNKKKLSVYQDPGMHIRTILKASLVAQIRAQKRQHKVHA